ncbi:ankyrin repeat domain-containing protein [Pantoea anthophila]
MIRFFLTSLARYGGLVFLILVSGCYAMNRYSPEQFFHGTQLSLARAIVSKNVADVAKKASDTTLNEPGEHDMTLLYFALQQAEYRKSKELEIISQLIKAGADPLQDVPDIGSVAEIVAASTHPAFMNALIDGGMNVNEKVQGQPLLHDAASDDTLNTLALMVNRGADVNASDSLGKSTVMAALDGMQLDTVEWLLKHGANPNAVETNTGWSFMRQLDDVMKRNKGDKCTTQNKLREILKLAKQKGGYTDF